MLPDGEIDFGPLRNNGDRNKILATVAEIVRKFIEKNPDKNVRHHDTACTGAADRSRRTHLPIDQT